MVTFYCYSIAVLHSNEPVCNVSSRRDILLFQKRLKDVETFGVSGHKQAKEVLRDMGQGLK